MVDVGVGKKMVFCISPLLPVGEETGENNLRLFVGDSVPVGLSKTSVPSMALEITEPKEMEIGSATSAGIAVVETSSP